MTFPHCVRVLQMAGLLGAIALGSGCQDLPGDGPSAPLGLGEPLLLTDAGDYTDPAWSPGGSWVSFSGPRYRGLYVVEADGGGQQLLASPDAVSGFRHRWVDDPPRVLCPARGRHPAIEVLPDGSPMRELRPAEVEAPGAAVREDDVFVRLDGRDERLTAGEDRFFEAVVSPGGDHVAAVGLTRGIHLFEVDSGLTLYASAGTHPVWTPDGRWLLFERTEDDGHRLTAGELWAVSVQTGDAVRLTYTPGAIEQHPSVSPDGERVAFVRDGAIWVADLPEGAR